jgi:predicted DNA-binding transcriptional regulator AlpA
MPKPNSIINVPNDKQVANLIDELRHRYDPLEYMSQKDIAARVKIDPWTINHIRKTDPSFPQPVWLTDKSPRWRSVDILNWMSSRPRGGQSPEWKRSAMRASKRKPSRESRA